MNKMFLNLKNKKITMLIFDQGYFIEKDLIFYVFVELGL